MSGAGAFVLLVGTHIVVVQLAFKQVVSTRKGLRHPRIWAALDFVVRCPPHTPLNTACCVAY